MALKPCVRRHSSASRSRLACVSVDRPVRVLQHLPHEPRVGGIVLDQQDLELRGAGSVRATVRRHGRASLTTSSQNCSIERTTWKN